MKSKSYTAIDIAKYISALLVVYIHTFPLADISADLNMIVLQAVCRIAVPFFFTVSAFLFFRRIDVQAGWHAVSGLDDHLSAVYRHPAAQWRIDPALAV